MRIRTARSTGRPRHPFGSRSGRALAVGLAVVLAAAGAGVAAGPVQPAAAAPARPSVVVATWNVCKLACASPAPSWDVRRDRVTRVIAASGADVVAVQEATDQPYRGRTQWADLRSLASSAGYAEPRIQDDRCRQLGCTHTARILIRTGTVRQSRLGGSATAGYARVVDIAPTTSVDPLRQVAWAYLEQRAGGGTFLAVSAHLTNLKTAAGEADRVAFGRAVTGWADAMNAARGLSDVPVVLMGDLNSFDERQPQGVQRIMRDAGWRDAIDAPHRKNADINSVNYTDAFRSGWPSGPLRNSSGQASRIDYILMRGPIAPRRYEVMAFLGADGRYLTDYQGSDHQMLRARLVLR
jgi:endonuclease/exonuclease/phosphatase family metal-dependent hydrolase